MKKWQRHNRILRLASERGLIYLDRAAEATQASPATLRRDFAELERAGCVERVRGGIRVIRNRDNLPFSMRQVQHSEAKAAVARQAVRLLRPGDVLFIDGGTTTYHICYSLPPIPLRIITNSLRLSAFLDDPAHRHPDWEIYLTGGFIQHGSGMLTGPGALHSLDFYHANWAFLSIGGITPEGLFNTSEAVVETERRMIQGADRTVILADQSKLGKRAMCRICSLDAIDHLIVNPPPARSLIEESLAQAGLRIVHSDPAA